MKPILCVGDAHVDMMFPSQTTLQLQQQAAKSEDVSSGKLSYEQKKEQEKQLRKIRKNIENIETELGNIEQQIAEYDTRFATATEYNADEYKAYDELKTRYDHLMHEWEKASYELEITENQ